MEENMKCADGNLRNVEWLINHFRLCCRMEVEVCYVGKWL